MPYYRRKLPRLAGYDYSQPNYYFVTICTNNHRCLFGGAGALNSMGRIAQRELENVSAHYQDVVLDKYVIMPNHVHAIFAMGCGDQSTARQDLSVVVGLYKSTVSRMIHKTEPELKVWQASFYDEIIRGERHYLAAWNYIDGNPSQWMEDKYFAP